MNSQGTDPVQDVFNPPTVYAVNLEPARAVDPVLADAYVRHTRVGDSLADAAMESLEGYSREDVDRLIRAGMDEDERTFDAPPPPLREFFEAVRQPPFTFDQELAAAGMRAFHRDSDLFFVALVLETLITGLSESLAKAFYLSERTATNVRRIRQNTRHLIEVMLPGGLDRTGDGWKHTVRIRLVHAQMRRLIRASGEWDEEAEGTPISGAHMALAATGFSAINLNAAKALGVRMTKEEADGFMHIWHFVNWLMGVPDELNFRTEEEGIHLRQVAKLCENSPGPMASAVANGYIDAVPELLGVTDPKKAARLLGFLRRVSRALIGHAAADQLGFPKQMTTGVLLLAKVQRRLKIVTSRLRPRASFAFDNFAGMMQRSVYDEVGISYKMPDALKESESSDW